MRKIYLTLTLAALSTLGAAGQSKFNTAGQLYIDRYQLVRDNPTAKVLPIKGMPFDLSSASRGEATATALMTVRPGADIDKLTADLELHYRVGDVIAVSGTIEDLVAASNTDMVVSASFSTELRPMMDLARAAVNADAVQNGEGLSKAYKGKGIIAGIYDNGMDPNHVNFFKDNGAGATRIERLFHFTGSNGNYTPYTSETVSGFTTDNKADTHGTHTMGIMAGSYNNRGDGKVSVFDPTTGSYSVSSLKYCPYYGIATEADIVAGCGSLATANILGGVKAVVEYAKAQGRPAVVNLSLGHTVGPHDGTSDYERAINELGKDAIICIASGNDGDQPISMSRTLTSGNTGFGTFITQATKGVAASGLMDIWGSDNQLFTVTFQIYNISTKTVLYESTIRATGTQTFSTTGYSGTHDTNIDKALSNSIIQIAMSQNSVNSRYNCAISYSINNNASTNSNGNLAVGIYINGKAGQRIDLVNDCDDGQGSLTALMQSKGITNYYDGDTSNTINDLACIKNCVVVGAFNTRGNWTTVAGFSYGYYDQQGQIVYPAGPITDFTSYGTLIDGRSLPHICAPGCGVVSSYSKYYCETEGITASNSYNMLADVTVNGRSSTWAAEQGTSMACPVVAGGVALMLEANPSLTVDQVRNYIVANAMTDTYTEQADPVQRGAGKFNLLGCMKSVEKGAVSDIATEGGDQLVVTAAGHNVWDVFAPGAATTTVRLYTISGQLVKSVSADDNSVTLSAEDLAAGVYIINVNGTLSERILVK